MYLCSKGPEEAGPMYTGQQKEDQVDVLTVKLLSRILITEMDMGKEEVSFGFLIFNEDLRTPC